MQTVQFLLALHNHQPVGNFENVFREAFEKCYDPFLHFLEEHPFFRVSLHYSGCLFDWFETREKQFLKRLKRLVRKNQVEMLGGGYYEPILPLIPEKDAVAQLVWMNLYLTRRFGKSPMGFWLTERVWEQKIPRLAAQTGLRYTVVDDTHFALAGLAESEIKNYFLTEEEGFPLYLFPIPKSLRYHIPFRQPHEIIDHLRQMSQNGAGLHIVTYADDGEKFGLWPGTYQWVYRDGWLNRFAQALLENQSWITLKTFSEVLNEQKGRPVPKIYPPSASYEEMAEWSLSREKAMEFQPLKRRLESDGLWDRVRGFFQGGTFKNFLSKYWEADWMRSRVRGVSERVWRLGSPAAKKQAQQLLWKAQCNCPYWHGVFGGIYLHHLRRSTYEHLIQAEQICRQTLRSSNLLFVEKDLNGDGAAEVIVESRSFAFYFLPQQGGTLAELDFLPEAMNVTDILTRREEAYHRELIEKKAAGESKGKSIHEIEKTISPEVLERVAFDSFQRLSFQEYFLPPKTSLESLWKGEAPPLNEDPTRIPFITTWKQAKIGGILVFRGQVALGPSQEKVLIEKKILIPRDKKEFDLTWRITNLSQQKIDCLWGSVWNFNFYDRGRKEQEVRQIEIQDGWSPVHVTVTSTEPFDFWQYPIETVAQTEKDFRLMHQGICLFPHWRLSLRPQESFKKNLTFSFKSRR